MHLLPTHDEVVRVLRDTGALRDGHFVYPNGLHSNEYLQVPLAMRYYQHAKTLNVGLSRLLRANSEIPALIPELSIVAPAAGGPKTYCLCLSGATPGNPRPLGDGRGSLLPGMRIASRLNPKSGSLRNSKRVAGESRWGAPVAIWSLNQYRASQ